VIHWLEKGKSVKEAIMKANEKYPSEALLVDDSLLPDLQARYGYLLEHERIMRRFKG
jgi:hypothetical protein